LKLESLYRKEDLASVHVLDYGPGPDGRRQLVEAVESVQPPIPRDEKWVLIVSTLFGCPVGCAMCDAGGRWGGPLSADQILAQIDHLVRERYPGRELPQRKWKIQFARMGEPAFNPAVLEVLEKLPRRYQARGLLPSLSTIAPVGRDGFFEELIDIKNRRYGDGRFQMQFSVHTTDARARRQLIPVRTWDLETLARYGERFHRPGDRKITLNFAACDGYPIDTRRCADVFDPERFLIKLTPLNPTESVRRHGLRSRVDADRPDANASLVGEFEERGFQVILSVGELEENAIGSNCGQFVTREEQGEIEVREGYRSGEYFSSPEFQ